MLRRLEPIAATDPPPDGCTPPRPRWGTSPCWRNAARSTELRNVSWLHIPKTGSTFAASIFRAAARRSCEPFARALSPRRRRCIRSSRWRARAFRYFASWHTPLSQAAAEECVTHQRHCVSVVRAPAERVESGFYHAMHDCTWLQQAHGLSESGLNRTFYATFADETPKLYAHCVGGCSSRMLTGRPCGRCRPDAVSDVEGCIRRVWREAIGTDGAPYLDAILQKARRQKSCRACVADDEPADDDGSAAARAAALLLRRRAVGVERHRPRLRRALWRAAARERPRRVAACWKPPPSQAERVARTAAPSAPSGARTAPTRSSCAPPRRGCSRISRGIGRRAERRSRPSTVARQSGGAPSSGGEVAQYSDDASRWLEKSGG